MLSRDIKVASWLQYQIQFTYNDRVLLQIFLHNYHCCSKCAIVCLHRNSYTPYFASFHFSHSSKCSSEICHMSQKTHKPRHSRCALMAVLVFGCSTYQAYSFICTGKLSKEHRKGMQVYQIVYIRSNLESCNKKTQFL